MKFLQVLFLVLAALPLAKAEANTARYACSVNVTKGLDHVASAVEFADINYWSAGAVFQSQWKNGRKGVTSLFGRGSIVGAPGQESFDLKVEMTVRNRSAAVVSESLVVDVHLEGSDRVVVEKDGIKTVVICAVGKE